MYRYDASYAVEVQRAHPSRFAIVKPVDPDDPAVADVVASWKDTPGAVGIRIMLTKEANREPDDPGLVGTSAAPKHSDQSQRRLHPVAGTVPLDVPAVCSASPHATTITVT
jgi:hypothetical protein